MFGSSRSKEMILAAALSMMLLLSACAGNSAPVEPANQQTPASQENGQQASATRMYSHLYGETEIPANPERIVVAYHLADVMALGVKPLGSSTYILENPVLDTTGIEDVGSPLNLEKIMSLDPDLIILIDAYLQSSGATYDTFNDIAPTVVVDLLHDPMKHLELVADIIGKTEIAEELVAAFNDQLRETKEKMQEKFAAKDETFTIMSVFNHSVRLYRQNVGARILYEYFDLTPHEQIQLLIDDTTITAPYAEVSLEVLPEYVGDHLIIAIDEDLNRGETDELMQTEIWKNLAPVQNGQVYTIDHKLFVGSDILSIQEQVAVLNDLLLGE